MNKNSEFRPVAKNVTFQYVLNEASQAKARLPMRVNIFPHDGTDSIIATVKNFYGLYDGNGVSFEDADGNTLIARYENFADKQIIYVRVADEVVSNVGTPSHTASPRRPRLGPAFEMPHVLGQSISRPSSRAAKKRSASPVSVSGHRSNSVSTIKSRQKKSRMGSVHGDDGDSDSDVGNASVTSSRRGKIDVVASAEISVDNIVEGGRRKRARFDSSVSLSYHVLVVSNLLTRNSPFSSHLKFHFLVRCPPCHPNERQDQTILHPHSNTRTKHSHIVSCHHHKALVIQITELSGISMDLEVEVVTILDVSLSLVHQVFFQHQILLLVVSSLTRMLHCN
jgi:hypothetical protein